MDGVGELTSKMLETCYTLEPSFGYSYSQEDVIFNEDGNIAHLLGKEVSEKDGVNAVKNYVKSRFWFTYRRNFAPIGGTGPDSDQGWGCMLRCAQMLFGETLLRRHIGKHLTWPVTDEHKETYEKILKMFFDEKNALYSIHQIEKYVLQSCRGNRELQLFKTFKTMKPHGNQGISAQMGVTEGKAVGEWIGPNTAAQVLKKLAIFDSWSNIGVHVALDNILVKEDVETMARLKIPDDAVKVVDDSMFNETTFTALNASLDTSIQDPNYWRPLLIIVPLRLGLTAINRCYLKAVKEYFKLQSCVGIIGGRPNHALYFVGIAGERLIYLDPHYCRPSLSMSNSSKALDHYLEIEDIQENLTMKETDPNSLEPKEIDDSSFHCNMLLSMNYDQVDPSLALAFFCQTAEDFGRLSKDLKEKIFPASNPPLFEQLDKRPHYWPPFEPYTGVKTKIEMKEFDDMGAPNYIIDDDFADILESVED